MDSDAIPTVPLSDAAQLAASHPATFEQPAPHLMATLMPGLWVKVCDFHERFRVLLDRVTPDVLEGTIDNDLDGTAGHGLTCGDRIRFQGRHVYDVDYPKNAQGEAVWPSELPS